MKNENTEIITYDSDEAAKRVEGISGWVSRDGRFWGDNEHMARWDGCTHIECKEEGCTTLVKKRSFTTCDSCREKKRHQTFMELERKEWDGKTPLYLDGSDTYFFDAEELDHYLEENECTLDSLQLRFCKPIKMPHLEDDYFLEQLHEDAEIPDDLALAIEQVNKIIDATPPQTWEPDRYAAVISMES